MKRYFCFNPSTVKVLDLSSAVGIEELTLTKRDKGRGTFCRVVLAYVLAP